MGSPDLRSLLQPGRAIACPGVYDGFSAALAEQAGFAAIYLSGASIAYSSLGAPDIGLVSMTEVVDILTRISDRVSIPVMVDADTGFGNALNTQRTVRLFERAGAAAIQLEDQTFPKRCGHLRDKRLVPPAEMEGKIRAAVDARRDALIIARTDAIAVEGFAPALERAERYIEAGADILFIEAPESRAQTEEIGRRFGPRVPLLANMVEGGRTPMESAESLGRMGYRIALFPGGTMRAVGRTLLDYFAALKASGTTEPYRDRMLDFTSLNEVLGTEAILRAGGSYETED